jgi:hypothetical protein
MGHRLRKHRRGQSAIEFVILVTAVLFFLVLFLVAVQERVGEKKFEEFDNVVNEIAFIVQDEINLASLSTDGYNRQFTIPTNINLLDYDVNVIEGLVYVRTVDGRHAVVLSVGEVIGDVIKGTNSIRKDNGIIYLN